MKDRVPAPGLEGRMQFEFEDDNTTRYAKVSMADSPSEEGTPLNKATLLTDKTADLLGVPEDDRTPEGAFKQIGAHLSKKVDKRIEIPPGADMNTYTEPGFYFIRTSDAAKTISNLPVNYAGSFTVSPGVNGDPSQMYTPWMTKEYTHGGFYTRNMYDGMSYTEWLEHAGVSSVTPFTPTVMTSDDNFSGEYQVRSGAYTLFGDWCVYNYDIIVAKGGVTGSGKLGITLPIAPAHLCISKNSYISAWDTNPEVASMQDAFLLLPETMGNTLVAKIVYQDTKNYMTDVTMDLISNEELINFRGTLTYLWRGV